MKKRPALHRGNVLFYSWKLNSVWGLLGCIVLFTVPFTRAVEPQFPVRSYTAAEISNSAGTVCLIEPIGAPEETNPGDAVIPGSIALQCVEVLFDNWSFARLRVATVLEFHLSSETRLTGVVDEVVPRSAQEGTVSGTLTGGLGGSFSLTRCESFATGEWLTGSGQHYELYYDANRSRHAVATIDDRLALHPQLIDDLDTVDRPMPTGPQPRAIAPASDSGGTIDLMILYTPAARTAAGGTSAIHSAVDRAVDSMNRAFRNSAVNPRMRLVHKQEIAYTELRNAEGNVMDHEDRAALENSSVVKNLRDQYGADMVCFFTVGIGSGVIEWPYALAGWNFANSSFTMAHELGHGLGCHHAVGDTWSGDPPGTQKGEGKYPYSHGWHYFIGDQRHSTIMAYESPDNYRYPTWAIKAPYYSNPDITDRGVSTGSRVNGTDEANNARSINQIAYTIANWRASKSSPAAPANVAASEMHEYSDKVRITWLPSAGATHYRVYRSRSAGDIPDPISGWQTSTTFDDTTVPPVQLHWYTVRAAKSDTGSLPSDYSFGDSGWRSLPPPDINASGGGFSDRVRITWNAVENADYYRVYRANSPTGDKQAISGWITATQFNDYNTVVLQKYSYWVQSSIGPGDLPSDYSDMDEGWRGIAVPTNVQASNGDYSDKVVIAWPAVEGASYYQVYRSNTREGTKTPISGWIAATTFNDTTGAEAQLYYYWVSASTNSSGFDQTNYSEPDDGWRKKVSSPTPTPTRTMVPIQFTPTPQLVTPTPIAFTTPRPTFQFLTPIPTLTPTVTPTAEHPTPSDEAVVPLNSVEVFDDETTTQPLTGATDWDDLDQRRLAIRWNYGGGLPITDWHVYVRRGDYGYFYLGRTSSGAGRLYIWNNPDLNAQYQFRVWGLYQNDRGQNRNIVLSQPGPVGYNLTGGQAIRLRQIANPTDLAPGAALVLDDLFHSEDLSGGTDTDAPREKALALKFNPGPGNFINVQVHVSTNGADFVMLGQTGAADICYFRWDANDAFALTANWREGPQHDATYWFRLYALRLEGGNVQMNTGPVRFYVADPTP